MEQDGHVISVLVCDDQTMVAQAIASSLRYESSTPMLTTWTRDPAEAVRLASRDRPDIVLVDLHLRRAYEGLEATRRVLDASPQSRVVIMTPDADESVMVDALEAGAVGLIPKLEPMAALRNLIEEVASGALLVVPDRFPQLLREAWKRRSLAKDAEMRIARLTTREREVLDLLADGLSNESIAERLFISDRTVETHVHNLLRKLGVASKLQAVVFAVRHGAIAV